METIKQTSKEYFRTLSILHIVFMAGLISLMLMVLLLSYITGDTIGQIDLTNIFLCIVTVVVFIGIFGGKAVYNHRLQHLRKNNDLSNKLINYRGAFIIRSAFLEFPSFISIIATLATNNLIFLFFTIMMLLFMFFLRPTKDLVITDLRLSLDEVALINNQDAVVAEFTNVKR